MIQGSAKNQDFKRLEMFDFLIGFNKTVTAISEVSMTLLDCVVVS